MPIPRSPRTGEDMERVISEYIMGDYSPTDEELEDPEALAHNIWDGLMESTDWFSEDEDGEPVIEVEEGRSFYEVTLEDLVWYFEQKKEWREKQDD